MELVRNLMDISLVDLQDDLDHFLKEPEKEQKVRKEFKMPFGNIGKGFSEAIEPFKGVFETLFPKKKIGEGFVVGELRKYAEENAKSQCYIAYDVYKKSHGMATW